MLFTLEGDPVGIELLYLKGNYTEAYDAVQKALKSTKKSDDNYYHFLIWEIKLKPLVGIFSNILEEIQNLIEIFKKKKNYEYLLEAVIIHISLLNNIGRINDTIAEINYGESLLSNINDTKRKEFFKADLLQKKGRFYTSKGEHETARSLFEQAYVIFKNYDLKYHIASVQMNIGRSYRKLADKDTTLKYLNDALEISVKYHFKALHATALSFLGILSNFMGDLTQALTYFQKCLDLNNEIGSPNSLGSANLNLGVLHHFRGNLNIALNYYQKALEYYQVIGNLNYIAASQYNIGIIYNLQGKLKEALEKLEIILPIMQKVGNISLITACFNSMGKIFYDLGLCEKAENHLKTVYQLRENITNISLSKTLFYLVPVLLCKKSFNEAKQLLDDLEIIKNKEDNSLITHRFLVLKGLVLSFKDNYIFTDIEKLYTQVINEPITDHETTIEAIIQLTLLMVKEYTKTGKEEQLERIKYYADRLSKLATKQQSRLLFVEHYWLKAIIASAEQDEETATQLTNQARTMAKGMNFNRLLTKMNNFKASSIQI